MAMVYFAGRAVAAEHGRVRRGFWGAAVGLGEVLSSILCVQCLIWSTGFHWKLMFRVNFRLNGFWWMVLLEVFGCVPHG